MSWLRWGMFRGLPALMMATVLGLPLVIITKAHNFSEVAALAPSETGGARSIINKLKPSQFPLNQTSHVSVSAAELDVLLRSMAAYLPDGKYLVAISEDTATMGLAARLPLPDNPIGNYVSGAVSIKQSDAGLRLSSVKLGYLPLPSMWLLPALETAVNWYGGENQGTLLVESIESVSIAKDRVDLEYHPTIDVVDFAQSTAAGLIQVANAEQVAPYLAQINRTAEQIIDGPDSYIAFVKSTFGLAKQRSSANDPVEENRAAILALAMYFGDWRIGQLVQDSDALSQFVGSEAVVGRIQLSGRHDFVQHFSISAGMEVVGGARASRFIYELKEVLDSRGGSGFSFTDLAANRAGEKFASHATASEGVARRLQTVLASGPNREILFPEVSGLDEGLSDAEFNARYVSLDSPKYLEVVQDIEQRVQQLEIYQLN